jgi:hypothetical protein
MKVRLRNVQYVFFMIVDQVVMTGSRIHDKNVYLYKINFVLCV